MVQLSMPYEYVICASSPEKSREVVELFKRHGLNYRLVSADEREGVSVDVGNMEPLRGFERIREYFIGKISKA